jgi:hypothetical protein
VSFNLVEFTMPRPDLTLPGPAPRADFLDLLLSAANGMFPGPVLEALIARMEAGK